MFLPDANTVKAVEEYDSISPAYKKPEFGILGFKLKLVEPMRDKYGYGRKGDLPDIGILCCAPDGWGNVGHPLLCSRRLGRRCAYFCARSPDQGADSQRVLLNWQ